MEIDIKDDIMNSCCSEIETKISGHSDFFEDNIQVYYKGKRVTNVSKLIIEGTSLELEDRNSWRDIIDGEEYREPVKEVEDHGIPYEEGAY